ISTLYHHLAGGPVRPGFPLPEGGTVRADAPGTERASGPVRRGQRVFTAGHSFHVFVAQVLPDLARSAGIPGHAVVGTQFLGGSHPGKAGRDALTGDDLRQLHAPYFRSVDEEVEALNRGYGKPVLSVVPVGQALVALRERVGAGQAPGLRTQEELFTDPLGHP